MSARSASGEVGGGSEDGWGVLASELQKSNKKISFWTCESSFLQTVSNTVTPESTNVCPAGITFVRVHLKRGQEMATRLPCQPRAAMRWSLRHLKVRKVEL